MSTSAPLSPDQGDQSSVASPDHERAAPILELHGVTRTFRVSRGWLRGAVPVRAVDGVDLVVHAEETLGLVGESGSGKTTLGRLMVRLDHPTTGQILYCGRDLASMPEAEGRRLGREIQMIFQDPYGSLNPRKRLGEILGRPLLINQLADKQSVGKRVAALLEEVGLPAALVDRFPVQLSGGQQQRVAIARAISVEPRLLVADEPLSALDVSVQAQVLRLLERIRDQRHLSMVFISHDLAVVRYLCHRVAVMYLGKIVELADNAALFSRPRHPYTTALLSAVPTTRAKRQQRIILSGEVASSANIPSGCRFHPRCWKAQAICRESEPVLAKVGESLVACHFPNE